MKLNKLFLFIPLFAVICAVFGFYSGAGDNHGTSAVFGTTDLHNAPQIGPGYIGTDVAGSWTNGQNVLQGRFNGEGVGYVRNDTAWEYFMGGDIDGTGNEVNRLDKYNVNTNTWTNVAPMTTALGYFGSGRLKDSIYTIGGFTGGLFTSTLTTVQKYDIIANAWTTKAPLPEVIGWAAGSGYQDSILYSVGGLNSGGSVAFANVYMYNSNTNSWRAATPLPIPRVGGAMSIVGDTIVYIGGNSGYFGTPTNVVYKGLISQANRSNITWSTGTSYPGTNKWRFKAMPWGCKGLILTAGGPGGFTIGPGETYTYSPGLDSWTILPNLPTATNTAQVASVKYTTGIWKLVVASGLILSPPYSIPNTQVFTDTLCPVLTSPLCEQFTPVTFPPAGWTLVFTGTQYWTRDTVNVFCQGGQSGSAKFNFYSAGTATTQSMITTAFTASTMNTDSLYFYDAYATFTTEDDQLTVYASTDGGSTYNSGRLYHGGVSGELVTAPPITSPFHPTCSQWKKQVVGIPVGTNTIKFTAFSAFGNNLFVDSVCVRSGLVGISHNTNEIPRVYTLSQNYPNPFNPTTQIQFGLPKAGIVKLVVYDILGREVKTLVNDFRTAGIHNVSFDASSFASGIYFYTIKANDFTETKKMLLVK